MCLYGKNRPAADVKDIVNSRASDGWTADYCEDPADTVLTTAPVLQHRRTTATCTNVATLLFHIVNQSCTSLSVSS